VGRVPSAKQNPTAVYGTASNFPLGTISKNPTQEAKVFKIISAFMFLMCLVVHAGALLLFVPLCFINWRMIPVAVLAYGLFVYMFRIPMGIIWRDLIE
jgi:membrane protein YdbS with pleckstrin-like domain